MTLRETLAIKSYEDVHLVHDKVDNEPATIVELNANTLTAAGKEEWADVLNAEVIREFEGIWGLQLELSGVKSRRLDDFALMLAGYCSSSKYDLWVTPDPEDAVSAAMSKFYLPVTWQVCGYAVVEADNLEAAVEYFKEHNDNIGLPDDSSYIDASFILSCDSIEELRYFHEEEQRRREL